MKKDEIIRKNPELLKFLGFKSKNKCDVFFGRLEDLRNNIPHAQGSIYPGNRDLIEVALQIKNMIELI